MDLSPRELNPKIGTKKDRKKCKGNEGGVGPIDRELPYCPYERGQSKRQEGRKVHIRYLVFVDAFDQIVVGKRGLSG